MTIVPFGSIADGDVKTSAAWFLNFMDIEDNPHPEKKGKY